MSIKHLLLLAPLLLGALVAAPALALVGTGLGACVASSPDPEDKPAVQEHAGPRVAFHVTGMKKTKSGAT